MKSKRQPGWRVIKADGSELRFSMVKHYPGTEWDGFIVETVEKTHAQGEYGLDKGWGHMVREMTAEELADREREQAEFAALTPDERTAKRIDVLASTFPMLDWGD